MIPSRIGALRLLGWSEPFKSGVTLQVPSLLRWPQSATSFPANNQSGSALGPRAASLGNCLVLGTMSQPLSPYPSSADAPLPLLSVDVSYSDPDTLVVTPAGDADLCTVPELQRALRAATRAGASRLLVELDRLTFMDAATLGVLVDARLRISAAGGTLQVKCLTRHRRLLSITGLDGMLADRD